MPLKNWWMATALAAMSGLAALPALGAGPGTTADLFVQSDNVIGARVQNLHDEKLGTIKDIVLTPDRQMVLYAVLCRGGELGAPEQYFAVPWSALTVQTKDGKIEFLSLDISGDLLDKTGGFDHKNWPLRADTTRFKASIPHGEFNSTVIQESDTRKQGRITKYQKASELTGLTVRNEQEVNLGDLECVLINEGKVAFALVSFGGLMGVGEKYSPVPWRVVQIEPERNVAMIPADKTKLESLSFQMKDYPTYSDPRYTAKIFTAYNARPEHRVAATPRDIMPFDVWKADSDYNKKFDASKMTTIEGTVHSVGSFYLENSAPGLRIRLQAKGEITVLVHGGPKAFAQGRNFTLAPGDKISATGSQVDFDGRTILMAGEIKKGDETLTLHDSKGNVRWNVNELRK